LFYPSSENCGTQGETIDFTDSSTSNECCEGLENVNTQDSVSVADECYWAGTKSGAPILTCSDCGNGICEDVESVCGCAEDCIGKELSTYNTLEEFCDEGYEFYCSNIPEGYSPEDFGLEICALCE